MPNWATNDVEVYGDKETLELILATAKEGTYKNYYNWNKEKLAYDSFTEHPNLFSFQSLVPMPDVMLEPKTGGTPESNESFAHAIKGDLDYPYDNAYDWHLAHWGTKWDLDQESLFVGEIEPSGDEFVFKVGFSTAWSPACQFWHTLSEKYGVRVVNHYYEEGMNFIGTFEVDKGDILNDSCVEITSEMYVKAGGVLDKDGNLDWDKTDGYDLSVVFPIVA